MDEGVGLVVEGADAGNGFVETMAEDLGEAFDDAHEDVGSNHVAHAAVFVEVDGDGGVGDVVAVGVGENGRSVGVSGG